MAGSLKTDGVSLRTVDFLNHFHIVLQFGWEFFLGWNVLFGNLRF